MTTQLRIAKILLLGASAALWMGCDKGPAPAMRLGSIPSDAAPAKPLPPPGTKTVFYKFGPPDSKIEFTGAKVTAKHEGVFRSFEGTIGLVATDPTMSAVQVSLDMSSVAIEPAKLTTHLKSKDFFDVAQFPNATFSSTTIRPGTGPSNYNVTGKLTLHGVTKPLTFPATVRVSGDSLEADGDILLNRKDFGIVYPGVPDDLIKDDVTIKLTIRAKSAASAPAPEAGAPIDAHSSD
ncbi:MAG: YceI family protein [Polyangiaceae bacterium]